jgi:hypothetical protein
MSRYQQHCCSAYNNNIYIVLTMNRCHNYGTLVGCSKCTVDLTDTEDLSRLSILSITTILLRLIETSIIEHSKIILQHIEISCNGIIRLPIQLDTATYNKLIALHHNRNLCISILHHWLNSHILSDSTTHEYVAIRRCIEQLESSKTIHQLVLPLYSLVSNMESLNI